MPEQVGLHTRLRRLHERRNLGLPTLVDRVVSELRDRPVVIRTFVHDYTGEGADRLPVIFELER